MFNISTIQLEKKSVFFINSFLIITMIVFFLTNIPTKYFFYLNIISTFILSYIFFKKSKKLSKYLIVTNLFIFFYFYPTIATYLYDLLGTESYIFILFYNIFLAYIFLAFSSHHKDFLQNIKKFNWKIFLITILTGLGFGLFFFLAKEPVPMQLVSSSIPKITFSTLILALSEQMIFSGFLFNIYKQLTNKKDSYYQVATVFVLFHLLRFRDLVANYYQNFQLSYLFAIIVYFVLLFLFLLTALYFYSFETKNMKGNFLYPVTLHFITDLTLIILTIYTL